MVSTTVVQSDGSRFKWPPDGCVLPLGGMIQWLNTLPELVVERVRVVFQYPRLRAIQFQPNHKDGLHYQPVESAGLTGPDATTPALHSKEQCTDYYRLIEDLQEHVA